MKTIIEYLQEYGHYSFLERAFGDVDSLVLCQLSYLKFDGMVPDVRANEASVTLEEISRHPDYEKLFADVRFEKENRALMEGLLNSRRFCRLRLNCYINLVEKDWETQFSAITFLLEDGTLYVAFRGTDETIVGWKEDFNMAFSRPVPGQLYSARYLNMVMGRLPGPFYVGGHSKGGNFAVYSAMQCIPQVRQRILKIYSMDGPGFRPEILAEGNYSAVKDRIVKILPHSSLVGMLFEQDIPYQAVESRNHGLLQHDPFSWLVEKGEFVKAEDIYAGCRRRNRTLNEWILSLDEKQLRTFIDTLYQAVSASQAEDLIEFAADWKKSVNKVLEALKEMDEQTERILREIFKSLFETAGAHMRQELTPRLPERKDGKHRLRKRKEKGRDDRKEE